MIKNKDWMMLNGTIYRIYTTEDLREMQRIFLERIRTQIPFDGAVFCLADGREEEQVICGETICLEELRASQPQEELYDGQSMVYRETDFAEPGNLRGYGLRMVLVRNEKFLGTVFFFRSFQQEDFQYRDIFLLDMVKEHLAYRLDERKKTQGRQEESRMGEGLAANCGLTRREREILDCIMEGQGNRQIGETLVITENTVKKHILNIYRKLGVRSRVQLFKKIQGMEEESSYTF